MAPMYMYNMYMARVNRTARLVVQLTPREKKELKVKAAQRGLTLSVFVRQKLIEKVRNE
jgi:hypothetical protein